MTTLREHLHRPRREPSALELVELQSYLDRQSRIHLAAWASHHHGGDNWDDHILLGIDESDWRGENGWALEMGIGYELPHMGWVDLFSMEEAACVRERFDVLWERGAAVPDEGLDPLDFRYTWEPADLPEAATRAFAELLEDVPHVRRVEATFEQLWKNGSPIRSHTQFYVDFSERRPHDFDHVTSAAREAGISMRGSGMTSGSPWTERIRTVVLYER